MTLRSSHDIDTDVLVVGGGAAGVAAAHAATAAGAQVCLVEKNGFLGGMATSAFVGTICGLFLRDSSPEFQYVHDGFMQDFAERLFRLSKINPIIGTKGLKFLPYERFDFIRLCDEVIKETKAEILFHTIVSGVSVVDNEIAEIICQTSGQSIKIRAQSIIDCSGHAVLGHLTNTLDNTSPDDYQAGAYVCTVDGLDVASEMQLNLHLIKAQQTTAAHTVEDGSRLSVVPGSFQKGRAHLKLSIPFSLHDNLFSQSEAEIYAREKISVLISELKKTHDVFANLKLIAVSPSVGMRTGPRYIGINKLNKNDVLSCHKLEESAARAAWPIEYWKPGERVQMTYFAEGDYYDIPMETLQHKSIRNLYFAGRHISADEHAIASARVIGTCLQMGESIGRYAAEKLV